MRFDRANVNLDGGMKEKPETVRSGSVFPRSFSDLSPIACLPFGELLCDIFIVAASMAVVQTF